MVVWEWFKNSWKMVVAITGAIGIIVAIGNFDDRYVKPVDLHTAIAQAEEKQNNQVGKLQKSIDLQYHTIKFESLNLQEKNIELWIKKEPKRQDLKEELIKIQADRENAWQKIRELSK